MNSKRRQLISLQVDQRGRGLFWKNTNVKAYIITSTCHSKKPIVEGHWREAEQINKSWFSSSCFFPNLDCCPNSIIIKTYDNLTRTLLSCNNFEKSLLESGKWSERNLRHVYISRAFLNGLIQIQLYQTFYTDWNFSKLIKIQSECEQFTTSRSDVWIKWHVQQNCHHEHFIPLPYRYFGLAKSFWHEKWVINIHNCRVLCSKFIYFGSKSVVEFNFRI